MVTTLEKRKPAYGLGIASLVLGAVGLLLFFLPVLGIPLASCGLLFGLIALLTAIFGGRSDLRWSVLAVALCLMALAADMSIALAPAGHIPHQAEPRTRQTSPGRTYVPPPADPLIWRNDSQASE
jgi:hypothetical protein